MTGEQVPPRFIDEHRITIGAPRDRVWTALRDYCETTLMKDRGGPLPLLLGTEPRAGFAVSREVRGRRLDLTGRHRFSRYRLVFEIRDSEAQDGTELIARTFADFPGPQGFVYKTLVIRTGGHALTVRRMLQSIGRASRA
ncbi:hypothetical protein [Glycomyces sp. NRRL B-16210]|uniref:hypothetical protein n=1 Tax=Glycomyces sp. NRRL B-16210 TaxID=1463821 RepID=UPI0018CC3B47|nr:hypothetical protein [Glycomyces sp. NRRL B-16210]